MSEKKPCVCIIVENLPVPLDRRVWQESCALRDAGHEVVVICPQMRGFTEPEEVIDGIQVYRHWISEEAGAIGGFLREYSSALWGEFKLIWKAWRRHRFDVVHLCNPPDLLFLVAAPYKLVGTRIIYDVHDVCPEMFEAKFGKGMSIGKSEFNDTHLVLDPTRGVQTSRTVCRMADGLRAGARQPCSALRRAWSWRIC